MFLRHNFLIEQYSDQVNSIINTRNLEHLKRIRNEQTFLVETLLSLLQYYCLFATDLILENGMFLLNVLYYNGIRLWTIKLIYQIEIFTW